MGEKLGRPNSKKIRSQLSLSGKGLRPEAENSLGGNDRTERPLEMGRIILPCVI